MLTCTLLVCGMRARATAYLLEGPARLGASAAAPVALVLVGVALSDHVALVVALVVVAAAWREAASLLKRRVVMQRDGEKHLRIGFGHSPQSREREREGIN